MAELPPISPAILRIFRRIVRRYFRRQFHAVRLSGREHAATLTGPLIIYANHVSWWDPMVAFLLAETLLPARNHYAPMDAAALERYRILQRLGIFPVALNSARGAAQFLRSGESILQSGGVLWVTPQGRFADPRERPLRFKPGLSALAARMAARHGGCTLLPLAIEYPFWDERMPECLLRMGPAVSVSAGETAEAIDTVLCKALEQQMTWLAEAAIARSPAPFETLLAGGAGVGGLYALGKRLKAALLRRPYIPEHTPAAAAALAATAPAPLTEAR